MDGKEAIPLGDEDKVTVLDIRDPKGALMIGSKASVTTTEKGWRKLTLDEVKDGLRMAFNEWGLPLEVQTDREDVYIGAPQSYFPSNFTLWLAGLGITHVVSRQRRPTDQAHVERAHRTLGDMVWKDTHFHTPEHLQTALDKGRYRYNNELPVQAADCHGNPPLTVYPHAKHSGRTFHSSLEFDLFNMDLVYRYLSGSVWTRKVWSSGQVRVGGHVYSLGKKYAGQTVSVQFVTDSRSFCFKAMDGTILSKQPARGLDKDSLIGESLTDVPLSTPHQYAIFLEGV